MGKKWTDRDPDPEQSKDSSSNGELPTVQPSLQPRIARLRLSLTGKSYPNPDRPGWGCVVLNKSWSLSEAVSSFMNQMATILPTPRVVKGSR